MDREPNGIVEGEAESRVRLPTKTIVSMKIFSIGQGIQSYLFTTLSTVEQVLLEVCDDGEQLCRNNIRIEYVNGMKPTYDNRLRWR